MHSRIRNGLGLRTLHKGVFLGRGTIYGSQDRVKNGIVWRFRLISVYYNPSSSTFTLLSLLSVLQRFRTGGDMGSEEPLLLRLTIVKTCISCSSDSSLKDSTDKEDVGVECASANHSKFQLAGWLKLSIPSQLFLEEPTRMRTVRSSLRWDRISGCGSPSTNFTQPW